MPEIGRPTTNQEQQYRQVSMGPKSLASNRQRSQDQINEELINKATGQKPKSIYKDGPHNVMGKDEFLKLLTFQMQHQDPMNPMDQSKMTGELAQFSQLEQLSNLNTKFDQQNKNQMIQDKFYAASFVGKKVITTGSSIKLEQEGGNADILFKLGAPADKVVIRITDEKNQIIGEIWKERMSPGSQQVSWDGVTLYGQPAGKGNYKAIVKAWDELGKEVEATTQASGLVQTVTFDEGEPVLTVDGQKVYLRDVQSFHVAEENRAMQNFPTPQGQMGNVNLHQAAKPAQVPTQQALGNYAAMDKGIYD